MFPEFARSRGEFFVVKLLRGTTAEIFLCLVWGSRSGWVGEGVMGGGEGVALAKHKAEGARMS